VEDLIILAIGREYIEMAVKIEQLHQNLKQANNELETLRKEVKTEN